MIAQLTSPTPVVQDQIAQRFLIYVYARGTGKWINMINIADYTDSKYNIAPDELKTLPRCSLRIVMTIMMFPLRKANIS